MKYIRTINGVYSETKYKVAKAFVSMFEEEQAKLMPTQKTNFNIIKQADTIEELCDEFVIHYCYNFHLIDIDNNKDVSFKDHYDYGFKLQFALENKWDIYGAIWTDKGLIYVAKMNNEGELELL